MWKNVIILVLSMLIPTLTLPQTQELKMGIFKTMSGQLPQPFLISHI